MNNLIKRSNDILHGVGRYNGIKKECRMGNTNVTGLNPVIEEVSCHAGLKFETFSLYTNAKEPNDLIGISLGNFLEVS